MSLFLHQNRFGEMYRDITPSLMDPLHWMGAVRIRVQTADKNITVIHTAPVHQLTTGKVKNCMFVINKSIIKTFLLQTGTSGWCLICAYLSPDSDKISFSLEKTILWIEDSSFGQKQQFEVKKKNIINMQLSTLQDGLELCGLLLLLFWRHPFTAEDLLVQVM